MNILITGAGRGVGYETVRYFARLHGMEIYALSRNDARLQELVRECYALGGSSHVHPLVVDLEKFVHDPTCLLKLFPDESFHLDILINNAGTLINKPFMETAADDYERMFQINFIAPSMLIRHLMPFMGKEKISHIVNISSMGGFQGSSKFPGLAGYSASKAALTCLTECLNEEYKNLKLAFNCLALGAVQTEMLGEAFPGYKAPLSPHEMAEFIGNFALNGYKYMKGKIIPVSLSTP